MEIVTKQFERIQMGRMVTNQYMIDEDYNVPDSKRDIKRIVMSEGELKIEEVKPVENYLHVSGTLHFRVLYETDSMEPGFSCMEGRIPFHEMLYLEDGTEGEFEIEKNSVELKISMIHSRKIRVKMLVELGVQGSKKIYEEIPVDVAGENKIYKKQEELELLKLCTSKRDTYRIKEEITLPGAKESIGVILWSDVINCRLDTKLLADELQFSGELQLFCFYESPEGKIDWIEQGVPYTGKIECRGCDESMFHHIRANLENIHIEIRPDEDGETRIIGLEGTLQLTMVVYKEEKADVLLDLYSLNKTCIMETSDMKYEQLILQNHSKCKIMEPLTIPELQNNVLQICYSKGKILVETMEETEDGIVVSGIIYVSFLYIKSNDEAPFEVWNGMIPFSHLVECSCEKADMVYDITANLEQIHVTLQGGNEVEIKAILSFQGFFRRQNEIKRIHKIQIEPIPVEELEKRPSIVGYIAKENEDLWELAKIYNTSEETIREINELGERATKNGERLLIFKENMGIL